MIPTSPQRPVPPLGERARRALLKAVGVDYPTLPIFLKVLLWAGLVLTALTAARSAYDFAYFNGTDLRIRMVGARAMAEGINPYTLHYSTALPERLQDPDQYLARLSRCPYPPSLLLFFIPMGVLPWMAIRGLSLLLEWCALFLVIRWLARTLPNNRHRGWLVSLCLIFIGGDFLWRLHLERGQYHIYVTALLAWGSLAILKADRDSWKSGLPWGLALAMRPTVLVILGFFVLYRRPRAAGAMLLTAAALVLATLAFLPPKAWTDWRDLVDVYERGAFYGLFVEEFGAIMVREEADGFIPNQKLSYHAVNSSIQSVLHNLVLPWLDLDPTFETKKRLARLLILGLLGGAFLLFLSAHRAHPVPLRFGLSFFLTLLLLAEMVAPIRILYSDVQLILPVALLLPFLLRSRGRPAGILVLAACLAGYNAWAPPIFPNIIRPYGVLFTLYVFLGIGIVYRTSAKRPT